MSTRPPKMFCRECGAEMGRGWRMAPLCAECSPNHHACACEFPTWDPECPDHKINPYDIHF